jgi:hypothetical protein
MLLACPILVSAQINRSAKELAKERITEYIVTKLYPQMPYKPLTFGKLVAREQPHSDLAWTLVHRFEIADSQMLNDRKTSVIKSVYFAFYLDKKMKVVGAESFNRQVQDE